MIRFNYTESPCCLSAANQSSSIRLRSRSFCIRLSANEASRYRLRAGGSLRDISPTLLNLLHLGLPKERTGRDLRVPLEK